MNVVVEFVVVEFTTKVQCYSAVVSVLLFTNFDRLNGCPIWVIFKKGTGRGQA